MTDKYSYIFLDRDGVINERLPGRYVQFVEEFQFTKGALNAFEVLSRKFDRVLVVTNQQGIGKGIMTALELKEVHNHMQMEVEKVGAKIDGIYFCPELATANPNCRKPNPGMAFQAKADFPEIDFSKSIIVGDSISDMLFGKRLGMKTILIKSNPDQIEKASSIQVDQYHETLYDFANSLNHITT